VTAQLMGDPKPGRSAADGFRFADEKRMTSLSDGLPEWSPEEIEQLWKLKDEGKSQVAIAEALGYSLGAVASKIRRTRSA
jgi:DNA-directed RNA polymerase specialized sigma24 family protein